MTRAYKTECFISISENRHEFGRWKIQKYTLVELFTLTYSKSRGTLHVWAADADAGQYKNVFSLATQHYQPSSFYIFYGERKPGS